MEKTVGTTKCMEDRKSPAFTVSLKYFRIKRTLYSRRYIGNSIPCLKFKTLKTIPCLEQLRKCAPPPTPLRAPAYSLKHVYSVEGFSVLSNPSSNLIKKRKKQLTTAIVESQTSISNGRRNPKRFRSSFDDFGIKRLILKSMKGLLKSTFSSLAEVIVMAPMAT